MGRGGGAARPPARPGVDIAILERVVAATSGQHVPLADLETAFTEWVTALADPAVLAAIERSSETGRAALSDAELTVMGREVEAQRARIYPLKRRYEAMAAPLLKVLEHLAAHTSVPSWERARREQERRRRERRKVKARMARDVASSVGLDEIIAGSVPLPDDLRLDAITWASRGGAELGLAPLAMVSKTATTWSRSTARGGLEDLRPAETVGDLRTAWQAGERWNGKRAAVSYVGTDRRGELRLADVRAPSTALARAVAHHAAAKRRP